jgi:hypothetical protein
MKFIDYGVFFLVCVLPRLGPAQGLSGYETASAEKVLNSSAQSVNAKIADDAFKFLVIRSAYAESGTKMAIQDDSSFLNDSLRKYLLLKTMLKPTERKELTVSDFADFDWDTFSKFKSFQPIKSTDSVFYLSASFNNKGLRPGIIPSKETGIEIGGNSHSTFLLPTDDKAALAYGVDFRGRPFFVTVTGAASNTPLQLRSLSSDTFEIDVNSDPVEADVYFNGILYYEKTIVRSSRPAQSWRVTVKKEGFNDYEVAKTVAPARDMGNQGRASEEALNATRRLPRSR